MKSFKDGLLKASEFGHIMENDPPVMSHMQRHTCKVCGMAVLGNHELFYGSASEQKCNGPIRFGSHL